jgi:hypothetical protein
MILKMRVRNYRASLPIRFLNAFAAICRHKLRTAIGIPPCRLGSSRAAPGLAGTARVIVGLEFTAMINITPSTTLQNGP